MSLARDAHLRLAVRKRNLVRVEHCKRVHSAKLVLAKLLKAALGHDAGLPAANLGLLSQYCARGSTWGGSTKHRSRCLATGRARAVHRSHLLSRLQLKSHVEAGLLPGLKGTRT